MDIDGYFRLCLDRVDKGHETSDGQWSQFGGVFKMKELSSPILSSLSHNVLIGFPFGYQPRFIVG